MAPSQERLLVGATTVRLCRLVRGLSSTSFSHISFHELWLASAYSHYFLASDREVYRSGDTYRIASARRSAREASNASSVVSISASE